MLRKTFNTASRVLSYIYLVFTDFALLQRDEFIDMNLNILGLQNSLYDANEET